MRQLARLAMPIATMMSLTSFARAEDWRFCVSASFLTHRAFITNVFDDATDRTTLEKRFDVALDKSGLNHEFVQCPLGGDRARAASARAHAANVDAAMGLAVTTFTAPLDESAMLTSTIAP